MRRIFTLFSMSATLVATAQSRHLTLNDALSLGFERNPAIVATKYAEQAAHRERQAAIGLFMPRVSIKGAYTHLNKDIGIDLNGLKSGISGAIDGILSNPEIGSALAPYIPTIQNGLSSLSGLDFSYTIQPKNSAFLGGDVVLPLFAGGKIWIANKAAKLNQERTQQQSRQLHNALTVEIVERYFGVALARHGVAIREEAVAVVGQHLHDVAVLEREGMAVESERLYAEYRLAEAERDLQRARLQFETACKALQNSLGTTDMVEPSTPMFLLSNIEPLNYFLSIAKLHNPQLGEVDKMRELARANLQLHRADLFPEIVAMGEMVFCDHQLSPLVPRMAVGVGLNFKIFSGLSRAYKSSAARLQLRRVEALEQKVDHDILLLVEDQYNKVQAVLATTSAVERSARFCEEYLRAKQRAFHEGMATATDVIDAALNLSRARLERIATAYEFDIALARLLNSAGICDAFVRYSNAQTAQSIF